MFDLGHGEEWKLMETGSLKIFEETDGNWIFEDV